MIKKSLVFDTIKEARDKFPVELDHWEEADRPHLWCTVEEYQNIKAQVDIAYGAVRLIRHNNVIAQGKFFCAYKGAKTSIVCLDKDYYSVSKYLWI